MTTPNDLERIAALRAAVLNYRDNFETDGPAWWYSEAVADLAHLWADDTGHDLAGLIDAIAHGLRIAERERAARALNA